MEMKYPGAIVCVYQTPVEFAFLLRCCCVYKSLKDYTKQTGNKELGKGDWLKSDRKNNTDVWKNANTYNLKQEKGHEEYTNIEQRAAFYGWFQEDISAKGFDIRWAGAASEVAFAIDNIANPDFQVDIIFIHICR